MTALYQSDFCLVRTPLLPFGTALNFFRCIENNPQVLSEQLVGLYSQPLLQEALYISSPVLYYQTLKYLKGDITDRKIKRKIETSLFQYFVRMSTRSTPFGLLAGFSLGHYADTTHFQPDDIDPLIRHIRFDMDYLCNVINKLLIDPIVRKKLFYHSNTSLYRLGNKIRYIQYLYKSGKRSHKLIEIISNPILNKLLRQTEQNVSYDELVNCIIKEGYDKSDAEDFVDELILSQVIVSEADPILCKEDYAGFLVNVFKARSIKHHFVESISKTYEQIKNINTVADKTNQYISIFKSFSTVSPDLNEARVFQLDLQKKTQTCQINEAVKPEILKAVNALKILNDYNVEETRLEFFKRAFFEKYENATVKLTEALDGEIGLDYNKVYSTRDFYRGVSKPAYSDIMKFKLSKYREFLSDRLTEIRITDQDLQQFKFNELPTPDSFGVIVNLFAEKDQHKLYIKSVGGSTGANLLARFCHTDDDLKRAAHNLISQAENGTQDKIFAEVVHLPQSRVGNILTRPDLRNYEIPYLANSTAPDENRISINDLYLKWLNNRLILFSKRFKKEVIPRLTSAHNFTFNSLPVYRFLCDLQFQGVHAGYYWNWGILEDEVFLPRVVYNNTILSLAQWIISKQIIGNLTVNQNDDQIIAEFLRVRNKFSIHQYVTLVESDNELMLNLNDIFCIKYLISYLVKYEKAKLHEVLWTESNLIGSNHTGSYANEIILPFVRSKVPHEINKISLDLNIVKNTYAERKFTIGTKWAYFKIYTATHSMDKLLTNVIFNLSTKLFRLEIIKKWFFIRYSDPKPHIRLRFEMTDTTNVGLIIQNINSFFSSFLRSGTIADIVVDTYNREIERYGLETMDISETIFYMNSELACNLLRSLPEEDNQRFRILAGVYAAELFVNSAGLSDNNKISFYKECFDFFSLEHNLPNNKALKDQLNTGYRDNSKYIDNILNDVSEDIVQEQGALFKLIKKGLRQQEACIAELVKKAGKRSPSVSDLLRSHIHMFYNRLFHEQQRTEELRMYCYLYKYHASRLARNMVNQ